MSNFPTFTDDETELLLLIDSTRYNGRGPRLDNTKARRKLKKLDLIYSRPLNANVLLPAAAGHGNQWRLTEAGEEIAVAIRNEIEEGLNGVRTPDSALKAFREKRSAAD